MLLYVDAGTCQLQAVLGFVAFRESSIHVYLRPICQVHPERTLNWALFSRIDLELTFQNSLADRRRKPDDDQWLFEQSCHLLCFVFTSTLSSNSELHLDLRSSCRMTFYMRHET